MKFNPFVNLRGSRHLAPESALRFGGAMLLCLLLLAGCVTATPAPPEPTPLPPTPTQAASTQIANPASENCVKQGGEVLIQQRGDGGEYGVCLFEDNRQCEEWALLRGECPVGGYKITGYVTPAAQYCAITGGAYQATDASNPDQEQGTCTFKSGTMCDVWDYYNGQCTAETGTVATYDDPFAYCAAVGTVDLPDARYDGPPMPDSIIQGLVAQGVVAADAPAEFQQNAIWRCMNASVWVCHFGANLPCQEKADASQTPTTAMEEFCKTDPNAENIPAAATGRATVYAWKCNAGKPEVVQQIFQGDQQGFLTDFWYELAAPQSGETHAQLSYGPVSPEVCQTIQDIAGQALATTFTMEPNSPFVDSLTGESGQGCTLTATGTGADFVGPTEVLTTLVNAFVGWTEQSAYQAGGPTGAATALTRDMGLMLLLAEWKPAPEVQCPADQPISACDLKPEQKVYTIQIQVAQK